MTQLAAPVATPGPLAAGGRPGDTLIVLPTGAPAVSGQLISAAGVIVGWSFRESGATVGANQEKSTVTTVGAAITAVLTDTVGEQTFITGFDVTLGVAAAAAPAVITVTGLTNPLTFEMEASTTAAQVLSIRFPQPLPGLAITVSVPAVGGVAANNSVTAYGTDSASVQFVVELWDGESTGGLLLACSSVPPGGSDTEPLIDQGVPFRGGLFLNVVSGTGKGSVWVRA